MSERVEFTVVKNAIVPKSDEARAVMSKLKLGDTVAVEIYQHRDRRFANTVEACFALIGKAWGQRVRNIRGMLMVMTGRADMIRLNAGGPLIPIPRSTSPREMNSEQFAAFWEDAAEVIKREILPTLSEADRREVEAIIAKLEAPTQ